MFACSSSTRNAKSSFAARMVHNIACMARWLVLLLGVVVSAASLVSGEDLELHLPPLKTSIRFGDQPITITAAGVITGHLNSLQDLFKLLLTADLADLQAHVSEL